ncbi:MAG: hypothetical protein KatS3mg001_235 [Candidatus Pacearchaeota archaeon]|nr:MAG: hypothetical protein KatS3mg001_235 [Candidatus Pacearchaeota archaeon]
MIIQVNEVNNLIKFEEVFTNSKLLRGMIKLSYIINKKRNYFVYTFFEIWNQKTLFNPHGSDVNSEPLYPSIKKEVENE